MFLSAHSVSLRYALRHFPSNILACLPSSVSSSKFRIPQLLCLPLLRKLPRCVPTIPILVHPERSAFTALRMFSGPTETHHVFPDVPNVQTSELSNVQRVRTYPLSFQILAHSFALFCTLLHSSRTQPIYFQALPHSLPKNTRGGVPSQPQTGLRHLTDEAEANESGAARPILYFWRPQRGFQPSLAVQFRPSGHLSPSSQSKPGGLYP